VLRSALPVRRVPEYSDPSDRLNDRQSRASMLEGVAEILTMRLRRSLHTVIWLGVVVGSHVACGNGTASPPMAPTPAGYKGEWVGTTMQGTPVQFSVSASDTVTFFSLNYNFMADCSGTLTVTGLTAPIHTLDPPEPPPNDQPGFGFSTKSDDGASGTAIVGVFSPDRRSASGQFALVHYGSCGTVSGTWTATRR
jgi:hypothetical protein